MRTFKDKKDDSWQIDMSYGDILRVKTLSEGRFDLLKPEQKLKHEDFADPIPLQALLMLDFPSLYEVLFMLVEPQARAKSITAQEFAERMSGQSLVVAKQVFREEWRDFFQSLQRPDQALALEKIGQWMLEAEKKLATALEDPMLKTLDSKVSAMMDSSLKHTSGKLEASLESTLARSPGDNLT